LVVGEAAELQREMRQASTELRKQKSRDSIEQTRRTLASVENRLKDKVWQVKQTSPESKPEVEDLISVGDKVWLKDAELEAQVLAIREGTGEVEVQAGQTKIKLSLDGVEKVVKKEGQTVRRITVTRPAPKNVPPELLLLGKRAEEVEDMVNNYLDDASMASLSQVRIVHGSGTGVLREIVREMLSHHPLVKAFRPGEKGEGGNGVTVVKL
jgi:DNA mismatch repair protein MutS2